ncbi:MAG TPA: hypothetical protein VFG84_10755 [Gemmatimonadaceae bacterium]|nr:hypothetical protein [Gemmatimonadaceae bacterium]
MPQVSFSLLPDDGRLWIFAAAAPLDDSRAALLLSAVDDFLARWQAHGAPLISGRDWRDARFLAVAVDPHVEGASGCSIDGLFRTLGALEGQLGTTLLGGGRVYHRDASGDIVCTDRRGFSELVASGRVVADTPVFDTTRSTVGDWRTRFELPARESWHASMLAAGAAPG